MERLLKGTENDQHATALNQVNEPNFIYIGTDFLKVHRLVMMLGDGIAVKNAEEAISKLKILLTENIVPGLIFIGADADLGGLQLLHKYILLNLRYCLTLFILDASQLIPGDLIRFRQSGLLDEIMFLDEVVEKEKFVSDITFLREIKRKSLQDFNIEIKQVTWYEDLPDRIISKRIFDFVVSLTSIILLGPLFLLIAILIRLESGGPVFYISPRAGRGYQLFNFYKFRTMAVGADKMIAGLSHLNQYNDSENGPVFFKISNDPRVTRVGAFLRNTSLDELPQLFNVLFGHMSLVGNRPLPPYEAAALTTDEWAVRFLAPAGITGLWQIKKRGRSEMSVEERIRLDIDYANNSSFMLDLWIIMNTPFALFQNTHT